MRWEFLLVLRQHISVDSAVTHFDAIPIESFHPLPNSQNVVSVMARAVAAAGIQFNHLAKWPCKVKAIQVTAAPPKILFAVNHSYNSIAYQSVTIEKTKFKFNYYL